MPTPDPIQGIDLPTYEDPPAVPDDLARVLGAALERSLSRFPNTSARNAAFPSPEEGQPCWVGGGVDEFQIFWDGDWRTVWSPTDTDWIPLTVQSGAGWGTGPLYLSVRNRTAFFMSNRTFSTSTNGAILTTIPPEYLPDFPETTYELPAVTQAGNGGPAAGRLNTNTGAITTFANPRNAGNAFRCSGSWPIG